MWLRLDGEGGAGRQSQIELQMLAGATPQVHVEFRAQLERWPKVGHAVPDRVIAHRGGGIDAEAQLNALLVEEQPAQAVAIGLEEGAAIDEVRHRYGVDVRGCRAAVVVEGKKTCAEAELPQRLLIRAHRGARRAGEQGGQQRREGAGVAHGSSSGRVMPSGGELRSWRSPRFPPAGPAYRCPPADR